MAYGVTAAHYLHRGRTRVNPMTERNQKTDTSGRLVLDAGMNAAALAAASDAFLAEWERYFSETPRGPVAQNIAVLLAPSIVAYRQAANANTKVEGSRLGEVIASIAERENSELMVLQEAELAAQWYWRWEKERSVEWNAYAFSDALERYKRRCRRWEERHNGNCCVVERVRDKYVMHRVREFLAALAAHGNKLNDPAREAKIRRFLREGDTITHTRCMGCVEEHIFTGYGERGSSRWLCGKPTRDTARLGGSKYEADDILFANVTHINRVPIEVCEYTVEFADRIISPDCGSEKQ